MENNLVNLFLAFIEGFGLIASPCILPILPIILSGSLEGNKRRPLGIISGFIVVFATFTLLSRWLVQQFNFDPNLIRNAAFVLLCVVAIIMLSTRLTELFGRFTRKLANVGSQSNLNTPQSGFWHGFFFGSLVALVWTPCAGPILAAVIVQTVIQQSNLASFFVLAAFALGAGVPMLLIAFCGRMILAEMGFLKRQSNKIRKALGMIILACVALMYFNLIPTTAVASDTEVAAAATPGLINGVTTPYPAPAIDGISTWINSTPLKLSELHGKVVLVDFWTYSCINCIRTLPYVKKWFAKYHANGLLVIGVHSPEFEFEKNEANVRAAVIHNDIHYPVAMDSNYVTWHNFNNQYWPAQYLINQNGTVVYQHFGEGEDDVMENNIRFLLGLNKAPLESAPTNVGALINNGTPETYLGYARASNYNSPNALLPDTTASYSFPTTLPINTWALRGKWHVLGEKIISAAANAGVEIHFHAKKVFVVMGNNTNAPLAVKVSLDGNPVTTYSGKDISKSSMMVSGHRLYEVLSFTNVTTGVLEITAPAAGLELYTFTFGTT